MSKKWAVAIGLVVIDYIVFIAPIGSLILAYMIISKDKSFFNFLEQI